VTPSIRHRPHDERLKDLAQLTRVNVEDEAAHLVAALQAGVNVAAILIWVNTDLFNTP
jgi:signal transduction histidine kinase